MVKDYYENEFLKAVKRSQEWGVSIPDIKLISSPVLSGAKKLAALDIIQEIGCQYTPREISQQCFGYMFSIQSVLEDVLESPLFYTLGYMKYNYKPIFYTPENELKSMMLKPFFGVRSLNLHAWLTTPNLEIIDLTFGTTYGVITNNKDTLGLCSFQHYTLFDDRMLYHPQIIGDDYLKKIGVILVPK